MSFAIRDYHARNEDFTRLGNDGESVETRAHFDFAEYHTKVFISIFLIYAGLASQFNPSA